ncbi:MAG: NADPH2:quinone reductase [Alteromonadaceae bacterium]|jgi:NADPH2:quinone reductase
MPKVVRFYEAGAAEQLKIEEAPLQEPQAGEVRLKVEAIGLNRAEIMFRENQYLESPVFPAKIGYEASGVIDAIGEGVKNVAVGDRISTIPCFSMGTHGVYGESAVVPAHAVAKYPTKLTPQEGTSIWMQYLTAYGALIEYSDISAQDIVLITAASSSVGVAAIQTAKSVGAKVIAVTRTNEKKAFLLETGADLVIATDAQDLVEQVELFTDGAGASVIFDPIGGPIVNQLGEAAAIGATIYEYGALSSEPTPFPLFAALGKALNVRGYTLFEITQDQQKRDRGVAFIYEGLESGKLTPVIDKVFEFDNIVDAHKYMESGVQKGKIVINA